MTRVRFVKMEGAGNDYVYIDGVRQRLAIERAGRIAARVADRHYGIGGDGLILLAPSDTSDVRMVMWNADGSRGSMCGNGIRCVAKLAYDEGLTTAPSVAVETDSGVKRVHLLFAGSEVVGARVELLGIVVAPAPCVLTVDGRDWEYVPGDAGNPHAVIFVREDLDGVPVHDVGSAMQRVFPEGVNVEFVRVLPGGALEQRTYERGSGETLACGSGATVAAVAAVRSRRVAGPRVPVRLRGGELVIEVDGERVAMEGPAREVFRGELELDRFDPPSRRQDAARSV